jgi:hypothetical protein
VGVQEVSWYEGATEAADTFFYGMGMLIIYFVHKAIISTVERVKFVIDRLSYIILRVLWCDSILLNVITPTKNKCYDTKDSFYGKIKPKYHMQILLGVFSAKVGREDIFKPTIGNESLHETSNDNAIGVALCRIRISNCQEYSVPTSQN